MNPQAPDEMDELSPAARALLAMEQQRPDETALPEDRLYERLSATLGLAAIAGHAAAAAAQAASSTAHASATAGSTAAQTAATGARLGLTKSGLLVSKVLLGTALITTGAVVSGGGVYLRLSSKIATLEKSVHTLQGSLAEEQQRAATQPQAQPPALVNLPVQFPDAAPTPPPQHKLARSQRGPAPADNAVANAPAATASAHEASSSDALTDENALIERARTALLRGQAQAALDALEQHLRTHPTGALGEERDALRVQALVQLGKRSEALAAAHAFRASYTNSLMLPSVESAIAPLRDGTSQPAQTAPASSDSNKR